MDSRAHKSIHHFSAIDLLMGRRKLKNGRIILEKAYVGNHDYVAYHLALWERGDNIVSRERRFSVSWMNIEIDPHYLRLAGSSPKSDTQTNVRVKLKVFLPEVFKAGETTLTTITINIMTWY